MPNKMAYPEEFRDKSRLHFYSSLFNSIEVNSSFYKLPLKRTVERWCNEVIGSFRFTYKISKEITHGKGLAFETDAIKRFFDVVQVPDNRKGCLLVQFPGKISFDYYDQLKQILQLVRKETRKSAWQLAIEFRHESWYNDKTIKLLRQHHAACVIHDIKPYTNTLFDTGASFIYIRFHGTEKNYRGSYTDEFLQSYARKIRKWLKDGKQVYAYFNNTLGPAAQNLITLDKLVRK